MSLAEFSRSTSSRLFAALAYRDYRTMWFATMASGAAAWALIVARGTLVFKLSDSSAWVGVVTFAAMAPQFFVPPIVGLLADRFDRRKLLGWVFLANLLHTAILAALAFTGAIQVWHIVVLSLINGIARASYMPVAGALAPNLVPREKLPNAVALHSSTQQASRLVGPLMIAPLMATVGVQWAFLLCAVLYGLGLFMVLRIRTASTGVMERDKSAMHNLLLGLNYVYHHRLLLSVVFIVLLHCSLTMAFESLMPVLARDRLGVGQAGFAYIMMADGAGAMVTIVALAGIQSDRIRGRLLLWLGVGSGLASLALAASTSLPIALASAAAMGATQSGFMVLTAVLIQSIVPDGIRGRVSSVYVLHVGGAMAMFNLVNGSLADVFSAPLVLAATGLTFVLAMALSLLRRPLRTLYAAGLRGEVLQPQVA
ncbi:MAG: MFS transporter [Chloroflexi bacterium]|nr:MFS transporter [Chloroflexota bacterium]